MNMNAHGALAQYLTKIFDGREIEQRSEDGYINGTSMAALYEKDLYTYIRTKRSQRWATALKEYLVDNGMPASTQVKHESTRIYC